MSGAAPLAAGWLSELLLEAGLTSPFPPCGDAKSHGLGARWHPGGGPLPKSEWNPLPESPNVPQLPAVSSQRLGGWVACPVSHPALASPALP
eukprot:6375901-Heterocapsa_arctica.AAC.1